MRRAILCLGILLSPIFPVAATSGENVARLHDATFFEVPQRLRPRVEFWKDIFTKYGKHQIVIHHRAFPQAIFDVIDLSYEGERLPPDQYQSLRSYIEEQRVGKVKQALDRLAQGFPATSSLEMRIAQKMNFLGGGIEKYQRALDEDMVRTQTGIRERFGESIRRSGRYLPYMEEIFRSYGLPHELTRLPFIESSFDVTAYSSVGAAGIWQFMRATAKSYMRVDGGIDDRLDPLRATRAAAQYLKSAYDRLGSWPLAVTSYNHGVGGVARKVEQLGTSDISTIIEHPEIRLLGFASNNFYPEFLAAVEVYRERNKHFPGIRLDPPITFMERDFRQPVTVQQVARAFGTSVDALRAVNFSFSGGVWSGRMKIPSGYVIRIPVGVVQRQEIVTAVEEQPKISSVHSSAVSHVVRKGETLLSIAKRYGVSTADLAAVNGIRANRALRPGTTLKLAARKAVEAPPAVKPQPVKKRLHTVKKGESLAGIAARYKISTYKLKELNHLTASQVRVGQSLVVGLIGEQAAVQSPKKPEAVKGKVKTTKKSTTVKKSTKGAQKKEKSKKR